MRIIKRTGTSLVHPLSHKAAKPPTSRRHRHLLQLSSRERAVLRGVDVGRAGLALGKRVRNDAPALAPVGDGSTWHLTRLMLNDANRPNVILQDNDSEAVGASINMELQNLGTEKLHVGRSIEGDHYFYGDIAEILLFDTELNQGELAQETEELARRWEIDLRPTPSNKP